MTCTPPNTVTVTVTGRTMTSIHIEDSTNGSGNTCSDATSCSYTAASGDSVKVILTSGSESGIVGFTFTYTCPGSTPVSATQLASATYQGNCSLVTLGGDYSVTASF